MQREERAMKRNLEILWLAIVVVTALSAIVTSAASAQFTSGSDATTLTAKALNQQVYRTVGTPGENSEAICTGEVSGGPFGTEESEITIHPVASGTCTISIEGLGFLSAEIVTTGCNAIFTTTATQNVHVECETGKQIEITAFVLGKFRKCFDFHAQTPTTALVDYHNGTNAATGKMDVEIESTVEGITYEKTGSCAFGVTEGDDAKITGNATVTGHNAVGEPVDVTKS
jgi:hypothetical protein